MSKGVRTMFDFDISEKMQRPYVIMKISIIGDETFQQNGSKLAIHLE